MRMCMCMHAHAYACVHGMHACVRTRVGEEYVASRSHGLWERVEDAELDVVVGRDGDLVADLREERGERDGHAVVAHLARLHLVQVQHVVHDALPSPAQPSTRGRAKTRAKTKGRGKATGKAKAEAEAKEAKQGKSVSQSVSQSRTRASQAGRRQTDRQAAAYGRTFIWLLQARMELMLSAMSSRSSGAMHVALWSWI